MLREVLLISRMTLYFYHDVLSVHFVVYVYSGGAHDTRFDQVFYYDLNRHHEIKKDDIIQNETEFLEVISKIAQKTLLEDKQELIYRDDDMLQDGLNPVWENFTYFVLQEDHLKIIFPPYQVGPWSSGEISIIIPYFQIAKYLKV